MESYNLSYGYYLLTYKCIVLSFHNTCKIIPYVISKIYRKIIFELVEEFFTLWLRFLSPYLNDIYCRSDFVSHDRTLIYYRCFVIRANNQVKIYFNFFKSDSPTFILFRDAKLQWIMSLFFYYWFDRYQKILWNKR